MNTLRKKVLEMDLNGFIFGPNDFSGSLGEFLNVFGEKTLFEIKK